MDLVKLLCRIISQEKRRDIKEEALHVCIAVVIGGNYNAQMAFCDYIKDDNENDFCRALNDQLQECFDEIKKKQTKRNVKCVKIIALD